MNPEQIATIKAVAEIITSLGAMPLTSLALIVTLGPWGLAVWSSWQQSRRLEAVVKMYEENVELVKDYRELVTSYKKIVDGQQELIIHVAQNLTTMRDLVANNLYCPWVRKNTQESKEPRG